MKKTLLMMIFLAMIGASQLNAQNIQININLDRQPAWGPSGYDYAQYYYIPDLNIYYDVMNALFYYLQGGEWVPNRYLPDRYRRYDLYSLYKIVINDVDQPWMSNRMHRRDFREYRNDRTQMPIRFDEDSRYQQSRRNVQPWVNHENQPGQGYQNNNNNQRNNNQQMNNQRNSDNRGNSGNNRQGQGNVQSQSSNRSGQGGGSGYRQRNDRDWR